MTLARLPRSLLLAAVALGAAVPPALAADKQLEEATAFTGTIIALGSNVPGLIFGAVRGGETALVGFGETRDGSGKVPDEVFGEPWTAPVTDGTGRDRTLLRQAAKLLAEAGWTARDGTLRNAKGESLTLEFLDSDTSFQRVTGPYLENLKRIGVDASVRVVDPSQYQKRVDEFDFDVITRRSSFPPTPDEDIRQAWHSESVDRKGSRNIGGIRDEAVDALILKALGAETRAELTVACRALDRVLRAGRYWIPQWHKASHWIAMWDLYDRPSVKPRYARGIETTWWVNRDKAEKLGKGL